MTQASIVPDFFLFGEAPQAVGQRFLHLEMLDERSRPNAWNIRPHAHGNLSHVFHISAGGGVLGAEGAMIAFVAPCVVLIPVSVVHGFAFEPETTGSVLTLSDAYLHDLVQRDPTLAALFSRASTVPLGEIDLEGQLAALGRELTWAAPGHAAAVEGRLLCLLVDLLRRSRRQDAERAAKVGPPVELLARFREMVEARYRARIEVEAYARDLGVSMSRLREACVRVGGAPPSRLIQDRIILEARRALLYSNMTIAEVGFHLGFHEPAYFSRYFTKAVGMSPRAFRDAPNGAGAREWGRQAR